ncbi:hypothetical protein BCR44DRAFT_34974 [Catenaria anguillulae PL171]|uniref:Uncharacterized protein n=1 Tax=Catenaria anguillulae PL171 TaxID=765915 RepID=A0A1Y2HC87_9FUNG|nr:hypothetical protein BCR44DRAFT_34974 [Catenaria anguillulae PL171]
MTRENRLIQRHFSPTPHRHDSGTVHGSTATGRLTVSVSWAQARAVAKVVPGMPNDAPHAVFASVCVE